MEFGVCTRLRERSADVGHFHGGVEFYLHHRAAGKINTHIESFGEEANHTAQ